MPNILKLYIITGNIRIWAENITERLSFTLLTKVCNLLFFLINKLFLKPLKLSSFFLIFLLKLTIPIVARYDSCSPIFNIECGLFIKINSKDKASEFQKLFFL